MNYIVDKLQYKHAKEGDRTRDLPVNSRML